ncbi:hypothetical protein ACFWDG_21790 [Peribacillus sp. NPDC060186]
MIRAQVVIFATGYEAQEEMSDPNAVILSSYAIVTNQIANLARWNGKMIWETARPYLNAEKRSTIESLLADSMKRRRIRGNGIR